MDDNVNRAPVLTMDGDPHYEHESSGCCSTHGKACPKCGGWMHFQAVYGGQYYQCEKCKETE